jgi:hypothetical protein
MSCAVPTTSQSQSGALQALLQMIEHGATHIGVATDHIIESFRNRIWPGYKTGELGRMNVAAGHIHNSIGRIHHEAGRASIDPLVCCRSPWKPKRKSRLI